MIAHWKWLAVMLTGLMAVMVHSPARADDCRYQDLPAEAPRADKSSVSATALSPVEGGELNQSTVIAVKAEYRIANFEAGEYFLNAIFTTEGYGGVAPDALFKNPSLTSAAGTVHLCIPLTEVYEHPKMHWPLSMRVNVMRREPGGSAVSVATSRHLGFRATDVPAGALERQAAAPPPEYHDSLMKAWSHFRMRAVMYKLCIEKLPAMQPVFTRAYRAWEARHRPEIDFINQVQFDSFREQARGRADIAVRIDDQATAAQRAAIEQLPAAQFKQQCEWTLADMSESDDLTDDAIGDEIEIVRKHAPGTTAGGGE